MTLLSGAWEVTPTQNVRAEEAVLGAVMLADTCLPLIFQVGLRPEHFSHGPYADLFAQMCRLHDEGTTIDPVTLPAGEKFSGSVPLLGNIEQYAKEIIEASRWHDILMAAYRLREAAETGDEQAVMEAEQLLIRPDQTSRVYSRDRLQDLMVERLEREKAGGWKIPFFSKRLAIGNLWLFGGWTSHGKSVWLDQIARYLFDQGAIVVAYLNEMTAEERICRHAASQTGISLERIEVNDLTALEKAEVARSMRNVPFQIVECAGWTAEEIARDLRVRKADVTLIDILHEIPYETERDLGRIMRTFTTAAKMAGTAIIATVHLNRGRMQVAAPPPPVMSDIKGASAFEQGADVMGMVYVECDEITGRPKVDPDGKSPGLISLLKVRQGKTGGVSVLRNGPLAQFERDLTYE